MTSTREARLAMKRSTPKTVLSEQHLRGAKLLPTRNHLLDQLPRQAVCAEVGVAFGDFTREIIARCEPKKLHLIDAWSSDRYQAGLDQLKREFADDIASGRVVINQGRSTEQLLEFGDRYFDWVYIDTDHSYETTSQELAIAANKVQRDGRILGDDFTTGNPVTPVPYGVIEACHEFCVSQSWRYEYLTMEPWGHFSFSLVRI